SSSTAGRRRPTSRGSSRTRLTSPSTKQAARGPDMSTLRGRNTVATRRTTSSSSRARPTTGKRSHARSGSRRDSSRSSSPTWPTAATTVDCVASGQQYFPDIASANGVITVVFYDSRADTAYAASLPPGDTAAGKNSGGAVDPYVAQSTDGGATWSETKVSTVSSNYNWETDGSPRDPSWR